MAQPQAYVCDFTSMHTDETLNDGPKASWVSKCEDKTFKEQNTPEGPFGSV